MTPKNYQLYQTDISPKEMEETHMGLLALLQSACASAVMEMDCRSSGGLLKSSPTK